MLSSIIRFNRGVCYPWAFGSHRSLSRCPCHCHGRDSYPHQGEACHCPSPWDRDLNSQILKPLAQSWKIDKTDKAICHRKHVVASTKTQVFTWTSQASHVKRRTSNSASLLPGAFGLATKPRWNGWNGWNGSSRKTQVTKSFQILIQIKKIKNIIS